MTFNSLFEKRRFTRKMNKFRHADLIAIVDLGKDEDGVSVEFSFPNKDILNTFVKSVESAAEYRQILIK